MFETPRSLRNVSALTIPEVHGAPSALEGPFPTETPECAVRSDRPLTASLYSDKEKFNRDLRAARNVNMSECALNQSSLQMTLNHRVPGSSPGAPTSPSKNLAVFTV